MKKLLAQTCIDVLAKNMEIETTNSYLLEFPNGDRINIPAPGDGWTLEAHWGEYHAKKNFWTVTSEHSLYVAHKSGVLILNEYRNRINVEGARILESMAWSRAAEIKDVDPSEQIPFPLLNEVK